MTTELLYTCGTSICSIHVIMLLLWLIYNDNTIYIYIFQSMDIIWSTHLVIEIESLNIGTVLERIVIIPIEDIYTRQMW